MQAGDNEQDINSYIDGLMNFEPICLELSDAHRMPPHQDETQRINNNLYFSQPPPTETLEPSTLLLARKGSQSSGSQCCKPKDYLKNMYNNSLKFIVKRYISDKYSKRVAIIHKRFGIQDPVSAKLYYKQRQQQTIGLTNLCDLLNYAHGSEVEKGYKKAFHTFYVWFMRRQYPIHILKTGKLQHAEVYWRAKNILIYLPSLKRSPLKTPVCITQTPSITLTQLSISHNMTPQE